MGRVYYLGYSEHLFVDYYENHRFKSTNSIYYNVRGYVSASFFSLRVTRLQNTNINLKE